MWALYATGDARMTLGAWLVVGIAVLVAVGGALWFSAWWQSRHEGEGN